MALCWLLVLAAVANSHSKCLTCSFFFLPLEKVELWEKNKRKSRWEGKNKKKEASIQELKEWDGARVQQFTGIPPLKRARFVFWLFKDSGNDLNETEAKRWRLFWETLKSENAL